MDELAVPGRPQMRRFERFLAGSCVAALGLLTSQGVHATTIDVTAAAPWVMTPSLPSATVLSFDDQPLGSLPSLQFNGGSLSGSGAIENTSLLPGYAVPAGDSTPFMTVSYPSSVGSVEFFLDAPENFFGLYWGSIDIYNTIEFLNNGNPIATFSGAQVADITGLLANGDQHSATSNRYVDFNLGSNFYNEVVLSTSQFGFEVDNIAFGDPPVPVDEPDPLPVLALVTCGIAFAWRRRIYAGQDG
ncbi:MAG TPA: hypothetical protein VGS13_11900 [Stellaceae bacterium]|nr:hypothetical protein [Stellaceae bacterium]